jgi:alpha-1,6-mannosyltransferase
LNIQWGRTAWYALLVASAVAYFALAYQTERSNFPQLISIVAGLFGAYAVLTASQFRNSTALLVAFFAYRLIWMGALPEFSDDYFRFLWDGRLWVEGINPFAYLPSEIVAREVLPAGISAELFHNLNSPEYFSVYPPIAQLTFGLAGLWFPQNDLAAVVTLRAILLLGDVLALYSLRRILRYFRRPEDLAYVYLLCPLTVMEFTGNLHYEGLMMGLVLNAYYHILKRRWLSSAIIFGLAISTKLVPLIFLPFLLRFAGWRIAGTYYAIVATVVVILFAPFVNMDLILNFSDSLDLYFRNFEFNASLYYLAREVAFWMNGYNRIDLIGPSLSLLTFLILMIWALTGRYGTREHELPTAWMGAHTIFLLLATTVHPWYISISLAFVPLSRFRYPVLWAAMAYLSYATYRTTAYTEDLVLVLVEYGVVIAYLVWEVSRKPTSTKILGSSEAH